MSSTIPSLPADSTRVKTVGRTTHLSKISKKSRLRQERGERGYVLVMTSILLPVLVLFIAMATDITFLYARSVQLQRIADTAALAGVTYMPRETEAQGVALDVAKRNGAESGTAGVTVTAAAPPESNRRLTVVVRDQKVPLFFGRIFKDYWDVTKKSTAEYVSNIPLGSKLNVIGNGGLTDSGDPQKFWLAIAGPCAPKETGDQFASRYDGNSVNSSVAPGSKAFAVDPLDATKGTYGYNKHARACDWDPAAATPSSDQAVQIAGVKSAADQLRNATLPAQTGSDELFPGLTVNQDYRSTGYNYIVDVPCATTKNGEPIPPPCPTGETTPDALHFEVFDPVFDPDSVQRFLAPTTDPAGNPRLVPQIKPDTYGVSKGRFLSTCASKAPGSLAGCNLFPEEATNPIAAKLGINPQEVTVATDFRIYRPDATPSDYADDNKSLITPSLANGDDLSNVAPAGAPFVDVTDETGKVQRFGTCTTLTGGMKAPDTRSLGDVLPDANTDYKFDDPLNVGDTSTYAPQPASPATESPANCLKNSVNWRRIITIPANSPRGKYRINVRTVSSPNSFGHNAFSLRSYYGSSFSACIDPLTCPSISGDTSMSVFAAVPDVTRFFLAKLSPPVLFRNKTVSIDLWDIGEGGDYIQVLRPTADLAGETAVTAAQPVPTCKPDIGNYCLFPLDWKIKNPGFSQLSDGLNPNATPYTDPCDLFGQDLQDALSISGTWDKYAAPHPSPCEAVPSQIVESREGFRNTSYKYSDQGITSATNVGPTCGPDASNVNIVCPTGLFNDRKVRIFVKVPNNYGCAPGTATVTTPCVEAPAPENGWWKIKYTPVAKAWSPGSYFPITDRTTWTVQLIGDPVHLVTG